MPTDCAGTLLAAACGQAGATSGPAALVQRGAALRARSFDQVVLDEAMNPIQESSGTPVDRASRQVPLGLRGAVRAAHRRRRQARSGCTTSSCKQVAVRRMQGALGATPAAAAGRRAAASRPAFDDQAISVARASSTGCSLTPRPERRRTSEDIRIGFEGGKIAHRSEMVDALRRRSRA
ncbi:MAG: hypothetical protein MZV65_16780 [Chromatiales bacterium]|nr:hypothetical protein [Chromatiales bacterium]